MDSLIATDTSYFFTPTVYAHNALQAAGLITYHELLIFDDQQLKSMPVKIDHSKYSNQLNYLEIYPNPAADYFIVDYKLDPRASNASIYMTGMDGKNYYTVKLDKIMDQKIISTRGIENGTYLIGLRVDGKRIQTKKIIIVK